LPTDKFVFLGFLPKKESAKKKLFTELKTNPLKATYVAYDSPERLLETLMVVREVCGLVAVSVHKEITKLHEERFSGTVDAVLKELNAKPKLKGEYVLVFRLEV
ncbi:MAG: 16S rRNA (cytidine(1402)-2'-O)-methyltransferase, partial [bacterium]|nr:16S rRNA (cytidine(1402)-2'-O)-methyltransferase [bacterium]